MLNTSEKEAGDAKARDLARYIFVWEGRKITRSKYADWMEDGFKKYFKTNLSVNDWRHLSQAFMLHWCPIPKSVKSLLWFAAGAGHSAETAHDHYSSALSDFQGFKDPEYEMYRQISKSWQEVVENPLFKSRTSKKSKTPDSDEVGSDLVSMGELEDLLETQKNDILDTLQTQARHLQASFHDSVMLLQGTSLLFV